MARVSDRVSTAASFFPIHGPGSVQKLKQRRAKPRSGLVFCALDVGRCDRWFWGGIAVEENADTNLCRPARRASAGSQQLQGPTSCGRKKNKKDRCSSRNRIGGVRGHDDAGCCPRSASDRRQSSWRKLASDWSARLLPVD